MNYSEQCEVSLHQTRISLIVFLYVEIQPSVACKLAHASMGVLITVFSVLLIVLLIFSFLLMMMPPSLKQSGIQTGNPWPPYKERTPLHPCYKGLIKLLHCKTLHIVIFTLLYKVSLSPTIHVV